MAEETGFREALDLYIGDGEHVSMSDVLCKAVHLHEERTRALEQDKRDLESELESKATERADLRAEIDAYRLIAETEAEARIECAKEDAAIIADLREKLAALEGENKMLWEDEISEVYTSAQHLSDLLESERTARREVERERDEALRKASGQPELRNVMGLGIDPDEE